MRSYFQLFFMVSILIISCSSSYHITNRTMKHMIALNGDGSPYQFHPVSKNKKEKYIDYDYNKHLHRILHGIKNSGRDSLLIYVHGGMKDLEESVEDTQEQIPVIDSTSNYYPIFLNWESNMIDAYIEQLLYIRQGKYSPTMGPISAPFYLLYDIGRAILRAPITWGHQGYNLLRNSYLHPSVNDTIYKKYDDDFHPKGGHIYLGKKNVGFWDDFSDTFTHFIPGILKIITTPLLDTFGKSAWQNMVRRTKKLFRRHDEFNLYNINEVEVKPIPSTGGASILMDSIMTYAKKNDNVSITLLGHSMGCSIIMEILGHYNTYHFENIVFMAPAASIKEFEHIVIPYLQKPENKSTKVYIITLHPEADVRENTFYDILPRGSLLEWVDDFASEPTEFTEVTLGKWKNIIRASHLIPPEVRHQIYIKGFGYMHENDPQAHGDFNDITYRFWHPDFWKIHETE